MNAQLFSEAMNNIDSKYIDKALNYRYRHKSIKHILSLAASLLIFFGLCRFAYGAYVYQGVGSTGNIDFNKLTQPFGTIAGEQAANGNDNVAFFEKSSLISDYDNVYADNSICVATDNGMIPSIYFSPNYMVIFSMEDEKGWTLKEGEKLTLSFSLHHAQSLDLEIGYILNGQYYTLSLSKGCDFSETLTASDEGEYYFCITNHSSGNAVIENGSIVIESSE